MQREKTIQIGNFEEKKGNFEERMELLMKKEQPKYRRIHGEMKEALSCGIRHQD